MLCWLLRIRRDAHLDDVAMKKLCLLCGIEKAIHFYRPNEWAKKASNRCSECMRVKKPKPGGIDYWRMTMKAVML